MSSLYAGVLIFVCILSEKQLPFLLLTATLFTVYSFSILLNEQSSAAKWMRAACWALFALTTIALFSPVDVRFRSKGLTGVHFLPFTYSGMRLSEEELQKAEVDPRSLLHSVDPNTHVVTHGPPLFNRAYYGLVIELP